MAVYSCPEISISIPKGKEQDVLLRIQELGTIELAEQREGAGLPQDIVALESRIMSELEIVNKAADALVPYKAKAGKLAFLADDRIELTAEEFEATAARKDELMNTAKEVTKAHDEEVALADEKKSLEQTLHTVAPFKDVDVKIFGSFKYVAFVPFFVHESRMDAVVSEITRRFPDAVVESIDKVEEDYVYVAALEKEDKEKLVDFLMDAATIITIDSSMTGSFHDVFAFATKRLEEVQNRIEEIHAFLQEQASNVATTSILKDVLHSELNQVFAWHSMEEVGEDVLELKGFVNPARANETLTALEEVEGVSVNIGEATDNKKVVMKNNWFVRPFEIVTKMMGTPVGDAVDPTPILAVFFVFMYGLALSEAGYGLVCAILVGALMLIVRRMKPGPKSLFTIIFYASISTLIIGSIFGSWFGVTPSDIDTANPDKYLPHTQLLISMGWWPLAQKLQLLNPLQQILTLMIAMAALGVLHLMVGLIAGIRQSMKRGNYVEGVLVSGSWLGFLVLAILFALNTQGLLGEALKGSPYIGYIMLIYMLLMIPAVGRDANGILGKFAKGAFDLFFGAIGYVSDILSYTRLVALGLATGIIAAVVNLMAALVGSGLAAKGGFALVVAYILMGIIFLGGHVFNIALNVLGSYITVGRLHFVEFFSKFFESGGQELQPFKQSEEYVVIIPSKNS